MKCCREKCGRHATMVPKLNLPAAGIPLDLQQPLGVILGFPLCKDHMTEFAGQPKNVVANRENLEGAVDAVTRGKVPPDWTRAWFSGLRMDSEEYAKFSALTRQRVPERRG